MRPALASFANGGYRAQTPSNYPPQAGPILELRGITRRQSTADVGVVIIVVEAPPGTWTALSVEPYSEPHPHTMT